MGSTTSLKAPQPFTFPDDLFPSFKPTSYNNPTRSAGHFGPPLTFNPNLPEYLALGLRFEDWKYQFVPGRGELVNNVMEVFYNVADNKYLRPTYDGQTTNSAGDGRDADHILRSWRSCAWRFFNIKAIREDPSYAGSHRSPLTFRLKRHREREKNWCYLAREAYIPGFEDDVSGYEDGNTVEALLEYRFNLRKAEKKVKKLMMRVPRDYVVLLDPHELKTVHRAEGWDDFVIRIEVSGKKPSPGWGPCTYQNAQLFRQPYRPALQDPKWNNPFHVHIELEDQVIDPFQD